MGKITYPEIPEHRQQQWANTTGPLRRQVSPFFRGGQKPSRRKTSSMRRGGPIERPVKEKESQPVAVQPAASEAETIQPIQPPNKPLGQPVQQEPMLVTVTRQPDEYAVALEKHQMPLYSIATCRGTMNLETRRLFDGFDTLVFAAEWGNQGMLQIKWDPLWHRRYNFIELARKFERLAKALRNYEKMANPDQLSLSDMETQ